MYNMKKSLLSLLLAVLSCGASMIIGTLGAVGMAKRKFRLSGALETLAITPVMIPEIIITAVVAWFSYAPLKKYWHGEDLPRAQAK